MRQLKPSTNLVLAVVAALGLLASLGLPWYATPVKDTTVTDGPVEQFAFQLSQVFATSAKGTMSGREALGGAGAVLVGLVVLIAVMVLAVGTPSLRRHAEDAMRLVVIAAPVAVVLVAVAHPGADRSVRIHYGLPVSFVLLLLMCNAAWHGATLRERRPAPVRPRYGRPAS